MSDQDVDAIAASNHMQEEFARWLLCYRLKVLAFLFRFTPTHKDQEQVRVCGKIVAFALFLEFYCPMTYTNFLLILSSYASA